MNIIRLNELDGSKLGFHNMCVNNQIAKLAVFGMPSANGGKA